jgi:hypothetical protein
MEEQTFWETIKGQGSDLLGHLKKLVHEGNVRRVVIKQAGKTVAEFPLSIGVVGTLFAPILAAIGALVALLQDCSIDVEKVKQEPVATPVGESDLEIKP